MTDDEILAALDRLRALPYWVEGYDGGRRSLAALKDMTSQLIGRFCQSAEQATHAAHGRGRLTRYRADLEVPPPIRVEVAVMKGLAALYVMTNRHREPIYGRQREVIEELVHHLSRRGPDALEPMFATDWKDAADDAARLRVIIDQVASLTDASALDWHRIVVSGGTTPPSIPAMS
jgi:dGTPase